MTQIDFLSKNVRGIGTKRKRISVFHWLRDTMKSYEKFVLLQETHSVSDEESLWESEYGNQLIFHHGSSSKNGVLIIPPKNTSFDLQCLYKDRDGRILIVKAVKDLQSVIIINVYAPAGAENEKIVFANELVNAIDNVMSQNDQVNIMLGGDLNLCLSPELDNYSGIVRDPKYRSIIVSLLENYGLTDVWRTLNPETKRYTWRRLNPLQQSRIDYWFVSTHMMYNVVTCNIRASFKSDHSPICISLEYILSDKRGPGFWKFNSSLLLDADYCAYMKGIIQKYSEEYQYMENKSLKWDLLKMEIRSSTIAYSKTQSFLKRQYENELNKKIESLEKDMSSEDVPQSKIELYTELKSDAEKIYEERSRGTMLRSKVRQIEFGEKNSKYFLNIEKNNYKVKHITKLITENEMAITDPGEILKYEENFYKTLLSTKVKINDLDRERDIHTYLDSLDMKKLSQESRDFCEKEISLGECEKAIKALALDKSPGSDGLNSNFYKHFWEDIKFFLFDCYQYSLSCGTFSIDMRRGVLSLNPKKDKDIRYLKHWRPLTLLNTDYKIIAKVMGTRLKDVLQLIINLNQVAYLKKRFIGQNIRVIDDVIYISNKYGKDVIMLTSDFAKAFDSVEWDFIYQTMIKFNFGPNFIKWTKIFYNDISSCVTNNGYSSPFFKVSRGIRQGCPLSAYLFLLVAETLAAGINQNNSIVGFTIGNREIKTVQMADDATLFLDSPRSLQESLCLFKHFGKLSGLSLNLSKSEALGFGIYSNLWIEKPFGLEWKEKTIVSLGIEYSKDPSETIAINFDSRLTKIQNLLNLWRPRNLSIKGKITVIKSVVLPLILYTSASLGVPEDFIKKVNTLLFHFLWGANMDKVKRTTVIGKINQGGLKMIDLESMINAQRVMWIKRLFSQKEKASWTAFLEFKCYSIFKITASDFFKCELHHDNLVTTWPLFYKQLLAAWFRLKQLNFKTNAWDIRRQNFIYNCQILIKKQYVRDKTYLQWFDAGIRQIHHLYDQMGNAIPTNTLSQKYSIPIDFIKHNSILKAIPVDWKRCIKNSTVLAGAIKYEELPHFHVGESNKPITLMINRNVYEIFVNKIVTPPISNRYWGDRFLVDQSQWAKIYSSPYEVSYDTRLQSFHYKIMLRIFPCNNYVAKFDRSVQKSCSLCPNVVDDLCHYFYNCSICTSLWNEVNLFLQTKLNVQNSVCERYVMLGVSTNRISTLAVNFIVLYTKYFIWIKKNSGCTTLAFRELYSMWRYNLNLNINVAKNKGNNEYVRNMSSLFDILNE